MRFHEMTAPQLGQVPREATVVLAPIAACEQHSLHLPTFTDTILVTAVAEGAEEGERLPARLDSAGREARFRERGGRPASRSFSRLVTGPPQGPPEPIPPAPDSR